MAGRKRKEIDQKQFESLCALQCTRDEICGWFDVTDKTLDGWCKRTYGNHFSAVFAEKRQKGKISLRRYQFQQAEKSASMAIWLGKQWLGQTEKMIAVTAKTNEGVDPLSAAFEALSGNNEIADAEKEERTSSDGM